MSYTRGIVPMGTTSIGTYGPHSGYFARGTVSTDTWPSANLAIYLPVVVDVRCTVRKLAVINGFTASGNFDLGLYSSDGTRLISTGSTAHSGTNTEQIVDVTDTVIGPGLYFIAGCFDNTTATVYLRTDTAPFPLANGARTEALGSVTLPATATWTADHTLARWPFLAAFLEATAA